MPRVCAASALVSVLIPLVTSGGASTLAPFSGRSSISERIRRCGVHGSARRVTTQRRPCGSCARTRIVPRGRAGRYAACATQVQPSSYVRTSIATNPAWARRSGRAAGSIGL